MEDRYHKRGYSATFGENETSTFMDISRHGILAAGATRISRHPRIES